MPQRVKGFMDGRCAKCDARIGWFGNLIDMPPCHKCGHTPDPETLAREDSALEKILAEARAKIIDREERAWANRTPEQMAAYEEGREAFRPSSAGESGPLIEHKANPYRRMEPESAGRALVSWFQRGWFKAEGEWFTARGGA